MYYSKKSLRYISNLDMRYFLFDSKSNKMFTFDTIENDSVLTLASGIFDFVDQRFKYGFLVIGSIVKFMPIASH